MTALRSRATAAATALVAGLALGLVELLAIAPTSRHAGVVTRWYEQNAGVLEWRAVALGVGAVAVVAFAASFRELTWSVVPERLWAGTIMVLAALGYAALASVAAATDLAILHNLPGLDRDVVAFGASVRTAMLVMATPAIITVVLGTTFPLVRSSRAGQAVTIVGIVIVAGLAVPPLWDLARRVVPVWFVLVGGVALWPGGAVPLARRNRAVEPLEQFDEGASGLGSSNT